MRGKLPIYASDIADYRITPADAGKTNGELDCVRLAEDHPRGCGENRHILWGGLKCLGSPPRMRGKRPMNAEYVLHARITPADAGKTCSFSISFE